MGPDGSKGRRSAGSVSPKIMFALTASVFVIVLLMSVIQTDGSEAESWDSDAVGPGLSANYDGNTLTVQTTGGTGSMFDWEDESKVPWYSCRSGIQEIIVVSKVSHIGSYAFAHCTSLTSVTVYSATPGNTSLSVASTAFQGSSFRDVSDEMVDPTGTAFAGYTYSGNDCTVLKRSAVAYDISATSSDNVMALYDLTTHDMSIGGSGDMRNYSESEHPQWYAEYRSEIATVAIYSAVNSVGSYAFYGCDAVTTVNLGETVSSIGVNAFKAGSLQSFTVDEYSRSFCSVDGVLLSYDKDTLVRYPAGKADSSYTVPADVRDIGDNAFSDCVNLRSVSIHGGVMSIGASAFAGCALNSVTISNGLTSIGNNAFEGCNHIGEVILPFSVSTIGCAAFKSCSVLASITVMRDSASPGTTLSDSTAFDGCSPNLKILVPSDSVSDYKMAFNWDVYENRIFAGITTCTISDLPDQTYRGSRIMPAVSVTDGDVTLIEDLHYTVTYGENRNAGTGNVVITGIGDYAGTVVKSFKIDRIQVSVLNVTASDKEYDGKTDTTASYGSMSGKISGDDLTVTIASAAFSDSRIGTGKTVEVDFIKSGEDADNYEITYERPKAAITQKVLTVTGTSADDKVYDAEVSASVTLGTVAGIVEGEDVIVSIVSAKFSDKNVAYSGQEIVKKTVTVVYGLFGNDKSNYRIGGDTVEARISPANANIVFSASDKIYDGNADASADHGPISGLLSGDSVDVTITSATFSDENAGKEKTVSVHFTKTGGDAGNYILMYEPPKANIEPKALTVTSDDATKVYDGLPLTCHSVTAVGLVSGDDLNYSYTGSQTDVGSSANSFTYTASGDTVLSNYDITEREGTLTVTARSVTVTADDKSKVYGEEDPELTATVEGNVGTDEISYTLSRTAGDDAGTYVITSTGDSIQGNYTVTFFPGALTVSKRSVTMTSASDTKVYDGSPLTKDDVVSEGFVSGEGATYDVTGSQTAAGTSKNTFTYEMNEGTSADNYTVTTAEGDLTVTKRSVTMTSASDTKVYDGKPLMNDNVVASGFVGSDGAVYAVTGSQTVAGSVKNTFAYGMKEGTVESNYDITKVEGILTVSKRTVTLTSATDSKVYDGTSLINDSVTIAGEAFVIGEGATFDVTGSQTAAGTSKNTFTYDLKEGTSADNYIITTFEGDLTVSKRSVTMTSASDSKVYDGTPLTNDIIDLSGDKFAEGEGATYIVTGTQTGAGESKNTFTYEMNEGTLASNYEITTTEGDLTVSKRTVILTSASDSKVYDGKPLTNSTIFVSGDKFAEGEGATYTIIGTQTGAGESKNTFTYTLNEGTLAGNYEITTTDGDLTVSKRTVTLTSASDSKVYDGKPLTNDTIVVSGDKFITGEGATYTVTGTQTGAGESKNMFTYTLNEGTLAGNYDITTVEGTLTVTKAENVITIEKNSACPRVFGVGASAYEDPQFVYSVETGSDIIGVDANGNVTGKAVGSAKLKISSAETDNYLAGEKTFDITIYDHIHVIVPGVAPTQTQSGLTEGEECSECHKVFVAQKKIDPTGTGNSVVEVNESKAVYNVPSSSEVKTLTVKLAENKLKYTVDLNETSTASVKDKTIVFSIEAVKDTADTYSATLTADGKEITGQMNITLPYDPDKGTPSVKWVENNERMSTVSVNENDKTITFSTTHNSTYAVVYQTPTTTDGIAIAIGVVASIFAVCAIAYFLPGKK